MRLPFGPVAAEGIAGMSGPLGLAWTVRDVAALLDATQGPDIGDPYAAPATTTGTFLAALVTQPARQAPHRLHHRQPPPAPPSTRPASPPPSPPPNSANP